jgi:hypothetical protein
MTQMSDPHSHHSVAAHANCASSWARSRRRALAWPLHGAAVPVGLVFLLMFVGCVFPPSLSVDVTTDAGANAAPAITSVRADGVELPEFAKVNFERGAGTLNLVLYDTDLDDTLYAKAFIEYRTTDPTPARSNCLTAGSTVQRSCTLDLAGLCQAADVGVQRLMQLLVFDRQVLDTGEPLYQAMPPGGLSTSRTYFLICQDPST